MGRTFSSSVRISEFQCPYLRVKAGDEPSVAARQERIAGFDQETYSSSTVALVGAGGINGENAEGFVRKGIGHLLIFDGDDVDVTNLNRQRFTAKDIGKNKGTRLAKNLIREGYMGTALTAYPYFFQQAIERGFKLKASLVVCGVDNDPTRAFVARYCLEHRIPAIFVAVSRDANQGYVFIQEPEGACLGCALPAIFTNEAHPCPGTPAIKDILKVVSGLTLYAADTILMQRMRDWNYRAIHLAGFLPDVKKWVDRVANCPLCACQKRESSSPEMEQ